MSAPSPFDRPAARELQRQRTRARLYEAALSEFARVGFDRASVAEIARAAEVSRPTFYAHFPSKEHVLLELQWRKECEIAERLAGCATLGQALALLPDALVDAFESHPGPDVARDMVRIYARAPEHLPLAEQPYPLLRVLERHFAEGARRGEVRAGLDPARAPVLCLTTVFGYLISSDGGAADRRADLRALLALYRAGA